MRQADAPLQKITLNIYKEDYDYLLKMFPQNYTIELRNAIHRWCQVEKEQVDYERG